MSKFAIAALAALCVGLAVLARWRPKPLPRHPFPIGSPEADASTLEALRRAGADLTAETDVQFYLYFADRAVATRAAEMARTATFKSWVQPSADGKEWLCSVAARVVPSETTIRDASVRLQAVAATMGGRYDGWEAAARPTSDAGSAARSPALQPAPGRTPSGTFPIASGPTNLIVKWIVALVGYVHGPIALHRKHWINPPSGITALSADAERAMPDELRTHLEHVERTLQARGFGDVSRVTMQPSPGLTLYASLLEHADHTTLASVVVTRSTRGATSAATLLRTDFTDGCVLISSNSGKARRLPLRPRHSVMAFSGVDPGALYQLHRFRAAEHARTVPTRDITRLPDPIAYQKREMADAHEQWRVMRYYASDDAGVLRPTWRGAVCAVWRAKFPWAQLTDWRERRARSQVLARFQAQ